MLKSAASKVMWVGRATVFLVGLAVILALVLGTATVALAAVPGDPFKLGKINSINRVSTLVGSVTGPLLKVDNNGGGPALRLEANSNRPPLVVNADAGKATNLNADKVDGRDAPLWAVVNADGTGVRGVGLNSSFRPNPVNNPGVYIVGFDRDISNCSYTATIFRNLSGFVPEASAIETDSMGPNDTTRLAVLTYNRTGNQAARAFHVQVVC